MTVPNTPLHNGIIERSFGIELNYTRSMLYQANFTEEMAVLYLQHTRNMINTMANSDKLSPTKNSTMKIT